MVACMLCDKAVDSSVPTLCAACKRAAVVVPLAPAGWSDTDESIRKGNLCLSYGVVIDHLSRSVRRQAEGQRRREAVRLLKEVLAVLEADKREFDKARFSREAGPDEEA